LEKKKELVRVYHDAGEVERPNVGHLQHDVVAEGGAVLELRVLGEVEETHTDHVAHEVGVDAGLEVDGRDFAGVHTTRLLDLLELPEDTIAGLVNRGGDEGDVERRAMEKLGGPGEELVGVHIV
jgi:hypothetical protein